MAEKVSRIVRSGGMLMVVDDNLSGGEAFETPEALVAAFSSAAMRGAGLSLTLLDAGGSGGGGGGDDPDGVPVPGRHVRSGSIANNNGGALDARGVVATSGRAQNGTGKTVKEEDSHGVEVQRGGVGVGGGGPAGTMGVEGTVVWWALFVCSKAPG